MTDGASVDYHVDTAELGVLARQLQGLHDELLVAVGTACPELDAHRFGGADVASVVNEFVQGWGAVRQRLAQDVEGAHRLLCGAVDEYESSEHAVHSGVSLPFLTDLRE